MSQVQARVSPDTPRFPTTAARQATTVLLTVTLCHLLNDTVQALLPASYPLLKRAHGLSFGQIGFLTLAYQVTASLLQPLIGHVTDARKLPFSLPVGMVFSLVGLLALSAAPSYPALLGGAMLLGIGSSIFHPESSRIARLSSGGRHGFAQSLFQVGGNLGTSLGPLLAAFVVLPRGQGSLAWFAALALGGAVLQTYVARWYAALPPAPPKRAALHAGAAPLSRRRVTGALAVLIALVFSKYFYLASFSSYYAFYLMHRFHLTAEHAQLGLFVFLGAVAAGTFAGGPIGDRMGRKRVIWFSIAGVLPFSLALPHVGLAATLGLSVVIGLILSSAFSAIVVYATELLPNRVGTVAGLFFGVAFGMGGLGAAVLGQLADVRGITFVYDVCAFLPAIGMLAALLPELDTAGTRKH